VGGAVGGAVGGTVAASWGEHSDLHRCAEVGAGATWRRAEADNASPMSMLNFVRYLLLPARPTVLIFIAALSLGFLFAEQAGLPGILLALVLLTWLFNYAYVLLEQIANGAREPPVLAIEMLNPANEQRPLLQLLIVLVVYGALRLLAH
jgi:hypothetical protein